MNNGRKLLIDFHKKYGNWDSLPRRLGEMANKDPLEAAEMLSEFMNESCQTCADLKSKAAENWLGPLLRKMEEDENVAKAGARWLCDINEDSFLNALMIWSYGLGSRKEVGLAEFTKRISFLIKLSGRNPSAYGKRIEELKILTGRPSLSKMDFDAHSFMYLAPELQIKEWREHGDEEMTKKILSAKDSKNLSKTVLNLLLKKGLSEQDSFVLFNTVLHEGDKRKILKVWDHVQEKKALMEKEPNEGAFGVLMGRGLTMINAPKKNLRLIELVYLTGIEDVIEKVKLTSETEPDLARLVEWKNSLTGMFSGVKEDKVLTARIESLMFAEDTNKDRKAKNKKRI